jgi:hypothetical protein
MNEELRDLYADRRLQVTDDPKDLIEALDAAIDEIDRLRRLLVWKNWEGNWTATIAPCQISGDYKTEADAWAAVRKAAMQ